MRDINRIDVILEKLKDIWVANPDLRLGQLVEICRYKSKKVDVDLFYIEDDDLEKGIEEFNK